MRYAYYLIIFSCFCLTDLSAAEPFTAIITAANTTVRSGPGNDYYPVQQLQTGDKVEVYYEQGEWLAIRPPIGSFSWVSAKYVNIGAGNVGTVLAEGLASRIGSDYSDDCETVQIALKKGESVFILDRKETPENNISPVWLKIAPPSGEFRWIHRSSIILPDIKPPDSIQQVQYTAKAAEIPSLPKVVLPEQSVPIPKIASAQPFTARQKIVPRSSSLDPFQRAFQELQQEAYVVMTRPTDDDVFAVLIQRADELHQIALTDQDLEKTYHLLESLRRTRTVRQEMSLRRPAATISTNPNGTPQNPKPTVNSGTPIPQQSIISAYTPTSVQNTLGQGGESSLRAGVNIGGYDIVGRLGEFDPLPKGHPPYAVVDENERIICLISPSANLNLASYVGQFVGINGILSYYEKPGKPRSRHLSVQNIRTVR